MSEPLRVLWFAALRSEPLPIGTTPPIASIQQLCDVQELRANLEHNPAHVMVIEVHEPQSLAVVREVASKWPEVGLVVMADEAAAEQAFAAGAHEVVAAGGARDGLLATLVSAARRGTLAAQRPPANRAADTAESGLVGSSRPMQELREMIARVAGSGATVLVRGETGTGKELVARAIHEHSRVRSGPLVAVHAAALPDALLESELFGHEKGAFTGATSRKPGRVELAQGGTLFLDEVAEISPGVQAKLLRLLQEREFTRLGGTRTLKTDARFIAATHRDLEQMAERREFRHDLLYRLNVLTVRLPPLRARRDDIAELARHFLQRFAGEHARPQLELDPGALALLRSNRWPGNVRELANLLERLCVLAPAGVISSHDVQLELEGRGAFTTEPTSLAVAGTTSTSMTSPPASSVRPLRDHLQLAERSALVRALERAQGNRTLAARLLGVGRRTLYTKLEEHGLL